MANKKGSGLGAWLGWGVTTLAMLFLNRKDSSDSSFNQEPSTLNITSTRIGTVIPVVMGQCLIKSPLTSYWGDFSSRIYTEEYGMHTAFSWWTIIPTLLMGIIAMCSAPSQHVTPPQGVISSVGGTTTGGTTTDVQNGMKFNVLITTIIAVLVQILTGLFSDHGGRVTVQKGFKYYLGYQQVLCWTSPNARLRKIYMNEKEVWSGDEPASNHTDGSAFTIHVDREDLFGGVDENGGFVGDIRVYFGGDNQGVDPWMSKEMTAESIQEELRGLTSAYRPFITVVVPTAYVGKSATIPTMWYEVEIIPDSLAKANGKDYAKVGDDANPAEIIKEIVSNTNWGLAEKAECLDLVALDTLAEKIKEEELGLSVQLTSKETAESIVENICNHINAIRYADPTTALMVHRLIRNEDSDEEMLLVNESNCSKITFVRQDWTNTVSEISVSYTDRKAIYETGTLSADDPANIEILNGVKTTKSYDYPYFTTAANALWAAKRVGNEQGYPLATVSLECNRNLSTLRLGDCFLLKFPAYGISDMVFRTTNVDLSNFEEGTVKIDGIEDVFSLAKNNFTYSGSTEWERDPIQASEVQIWGVWEEPYEFSRVAYTYVRMYACQPTLNNVLWHVWRMAEDESTFSATNSSNAWTPVGKLVYDYKADGDVEDVRGFVIREVSGITDMYDELLIPNTSDIDVARQASRYAIIGDEWIAYSGLSQLPNGNWRVLGVLRGIFDTVPQTHASTDTIIFLRSGHYQNVKTGGWVCGAGKTTTEHYSITTDSPTTKGQLNTALNVEYETGRRSERPTVPGRIRMSAHNLNDQYYATKISGDLTITWKPRDKENSYIAVSQDDINDYYSKSAIEKPDGENYLVEVLVNGQSVRKDTVEDESWYYSWGDRCKDCSDVTAETTIQIYCEKNGLESWQRQERTVTWTIPTMIGIAHNLADALAIVAAMDKDGQIVMPEGVYNQTQYIDYADSPAVLIGTPAPSFDTPGAVMAANGAFWVPDGNVIRFSDATTYVEDLPVDGYTVRTWYKEAQLAVPDYYKWNATKNIFEVIS